MPRRQRGSVVRDFRAAHIQPPAWKMFEAYGRLAIPAAIWNRTPLALIEIICTANAKNRYRTLTYDNFCDTTMDNHHRVARYSMSDAQLAALTKKPSPMSDADLMTTRKVLTVMEASRILRLSRMATYEGVWSGAIPSVRVGRAIRVPVTGLKAMLGEADPIDPAAPTEEAAA
jgi:excisionase family DNA binding protein